MKMEFEKLADYHNTAVVVPVYNCECYLVQLVKRIKKYFPVDRIFMVNDASTDNSLSVMSGLGINIINFKINKGKGAALQAGLTSCSRKGYDFAFSLDGDLQHQPEDIPAFLDVQNKRRSGLVIGSRSFKLGKMPFMRILSNSLTSMTVSIVTGRKIRDSQSGFRLYSLDIFRLFDYRSDKYQFETEIILKFAKKTGIDFVPIQTVYSDQVSYITHFRDISNFIKIVIAEIIQKEKNENSFNQ